MKNSLVDSLIGAALKTNYIHSSKPKLVLILLNTNFLANPHMKGFDLFPVISENVPSGPIDFAQSAIFLLIPVV